MSCPECFTGHVHHGTPKGTIKELHGAKTYVTLPSSTHAEPKNTIIFYCDAFGLNLVNNKLLADRYAAETGCRVLAPDLFPGGAASVETMMAINNLTRPVPSSLSYLNPLMYTGKAYHLVRTLGGMVPFMYYNYPSKAFPGCLRYAREVRAAMPSDGHLGVAGFCWGGYQVTKLACEPVTEGGDKALIDAVFTAHPSALKIPDDMIAAVDTFKVPYSCAVAEEDFQFDKKSAHNTEKKLKEKLGAGVGTYEFVVWEGCHHGFAVRASLEEDSTGDKGYDGAAKQAVDWFNKHLT
ncbi:hypothetical protein N0V82_003948 [Gnomoniopsis sp. IMI 355080]|nr:hypothetical protein N0V82_003948 [Gnomoniopsis sp. IMI 355080]